MIKKSTLISASIIFLNFGCQHEEEGDLPQDQPVPQASTPIYETVVEAPTEAQSPKANVIVRSENDHKEDGERLNKKYANRDEDEDFKIEDITPPENVPPINPADPLNTGVAHGPGVGPAPVPPPVLPPDLPLGPRLFIGAGCGDGIRAGAEECDDGNDINKDECNNFCLLPFCGNFIVDRGEECDDGNKDPGDFCGPRCLYERCGNKYLDPNEECDDGNFDDGDGCSSFCEFESAAAVDENDELTK